MTSGSLYSLPPVEPCGTQLHRVKPVLKQCPQIIGRVFFGRANGRVNFAATRHPWLIVRCESCGCHSFFPLESYGEDSGPRCLRPECDTGGRKEASYKWECLDSAGWAQTLCAG